MPYKCCIEHCGSVSESPGITLHRFPTNKPEFKYWIAFVRVQNERPDWSPGDSSRLCSLHFRDNQYNVFSSGKKRIRDDAVPSVSFDDVEEFDGTVTEGEKSYSSVQASGGQSEVPSTRY